MEEALPSAFRSQTPEWEKSLKAGQCANPVPCNEQDNKLEAIRRQGSLGFLPSQPQAPMKRPSVARTAHWSGESSTNSLSNNSTFSSQSVPIPTLAAGIDPAYLNTPTKSQGFNMYRQDIRQQRQAHILTTADVPAHYGSADQVDLTTTIGKLDPYSQSSNAVSHSQHTSLPLADNSSHMSSFVTPVVAPRTAISAAHTQAAGLLSPVSPSPQARKRLRF